MRSVFVKEWRQGHMIALFGLLMGGLVTALWGILTVAYVRNWQDQQGVNVFCGAMYYIVPIILAIFVGSGLFAAEVERGTLPLLLSLPFSRGQVWLGKIAAGLALMLLAVVLVIIPGAIAVRPALEEVDFWTFLPDLALASVLLYIGAVLWSTVCRTIVNAFLSTVVLGGVLFIYSVLMLVFGGRLLGPPMLDVELWALSAVPALVVGSYLGFVRGELFKPKRRWVVPISAAIAVYLITTVALIGVVRWETRYERSKVDAIGGVQLGGGGKAVGLVSLGSPVDLHREAEIRINSGSRAGYRRVYGTCVDLKTGKELLTRRGSDVPVVSPDGTYAAVLSEPRPLTWRGQSARGNIVEVWELARHTLIYRGVPRVPGAVFPRYTSDLEWSPDGRWLAVSGEGGQSVLFMRPDGSGSQQIGVLDPMGVGGTWAFGPDGDIVYALEQDGSLVRHDLSGQKPRTIWRATATEAVPSSLRFPYDFPYRQIAVSPDGGQVAIVAHFRPRTPNAMGDVVNVHALFVVPTDGGRSQIVMRELTYRGETTTYPSESRLIWSSDSQYVRYVRTFLRSPQVASRVQVVTWSASHGIASSVIPAGGGPAEIAVAPDGRVLVACSTSAWLIGPSGQVRRLSDGVASAFDHAGLSGIDAQGRAILNKVANLDRSYLAAVDLDSGQLTKIYP